MSTVINQAPKPPQQSANSTSNASFSSVHPAQQDNASSVGSESEDAQNFSQQFSALQKQGKLPEAIEQLAVNGNRSASTPNEPVEEEVSAKTEETDDEAIAPEILAFLSSMTVPQQSMAPQPESNNASDERPNNPAAKSLNTIGKLNAQLSSLTQQMSQTQTAEIKAGDNHAALSTPFSLAKSDNSQLLGMESPSIKTLSPVSVLNHTPDAAASPSSGSLTLPQPTVTSVDKPAWANLQVDTSQGKWGEQMLQVLQDRVALQANSKMQEAHIRLDPPELGKLDLLVKVDGDKLNVQINASHAHVREALVQVSERLRNELQHQQFVHVDVNVGADTSRDSASHQFDQEPDDDYQISAAINAQTQGNEDAHSPLSEYWLSTSA